MGVTRTAGTGSPAIDVWGDQHATEPPCSAAPDAFVRSDSRARNARAVATCLACPLLMPCRQYAAGHQWQAITVAAWTAPARWAAFPPWAADDPRRPAGGWRTLPGEPKRAPNRLSLLP